MQDQNSSGEQTSNQPQHSRPHSGMLNKMTLSNMAGDMNFLGVAGIIFGIMYSLTIVGLIYGLPIIFASLRLREASEAYKSYVGNNLSDEMTLQFALEKQARAFYIMKVLAIIIIALTVISLLFMLLFFGFAVNMMEGIDSV
ncbi:MAG: DUF5362 domain-containing protein [Candidatus Kapaibacterium sp.]